MSAVFTHLILAFHDVPFDMLAVTAMARIPTETERAGIRAALTEAA